MPAMSTNNRFGRGQRCNGRAVVRLVGPESAAASHGQRPALDDPSDLHLHLPLPVPPSASATAAKTDSQVYANGVAASASGAQRAPLPPLPKRRHLRHPKEGGGKRRIA